MFFLRLLKVRYIFEQHNFIKRKQIENHNMINSLHNNLRLNRQHKVFHFILLKRLLLNFFSMTYVDQDELIAPDLLKDVSHLRPFFGGCVACLLFEKSSAWPIQHGSRKITFIHCILPREALSCLVLFFNVHPSCGKKCQRFFFIQKK